VTTFIIWLLHKMGFWWFPSKKNALSKGSLLLFWREQSNRTVGLEWSFGRQANMCHAYVEFASEDDYVFSLALPRLLQVWVTIANARPFIFWNPNERLDRTFETRDRDGAKRIAHYGRWWEGRHVGAQISGGSIRLFLFSDRMNHSYYKHVWFTERMREPSLNVKRIFERIVFGKEVYSNDKLSDAMAIRVPMPEGNYDAVIQHGRRVWGWQRFRKPIIKDSTDIELENPPNFAGKGENGWDMDDDAIYGTSFQGHLTPDEAAHQYRELVLKERNKYGEPMGAQ
jgi:hypothetical protein